MEADPQWNGILGDGCNLPTDCVSCDIFECPGRESEQPLLAVNSPVVQRYLKRYLKPIFKKKVSSMPELCTFLAAADCLFTEDPALAEPKEVQS